MYRYTFNAGTGFDSKGNAIAPEDLAEPLAIIRNTLVDTFGGFTETDTIGGWKDDSGNIVMESGKQWTCASDTPTDARVIAGRIAFLLQQTAVMLTAEETQTQFVMEQERVTA